MFAAVLSPELISETSLGEKSTGDSWHCGNLLSIFTVCSPQFLLDVTTVVTKANAFSGLSSRR